ncbi:MAG: nucleoside hydrolase [Promethearchaeota archaeon]
MIWKLIRILGRVAVIPLYFILKITGILKKDYSFPSQSLKTSKNSTMEEKQEKRLIIIDDDVGLFRDGVWKEGHYWLPWLKITDPDGGVELIYALKDSNVKILGITIMMGVAPRDVCVKAAKNVLKILGMENIPIYPGARTPDDLGKVTEAVRFIINSVMNNPGKVEIIATGPLTNIATALMLEPRLPKFWKTLHFATGEFRGKLGEISDLYIPSLLGIPDLNINVDVRATQYVLKHGGSFPIYPNEIMDDIILTKKDMSIIKSSKSELAKFIDYELKIVDFLFNYFTPFSKGIIPHGVVPVGIALERNCDCKIIESAVELKYFKMQGYAFVLSNDPSLPKHKIYVKLSENCKRKIHNKLLKRLIK